MMELKLTTWIILHCWIVDLLECRQRYRARRETRLRADHVVFNTTTASISLCTAYYEAYPDCISLSFYSAQGTCWVSPSKSNIDEFDGGNNIGPALEVRVGWTTMSKVRHHVVHLIVGPNVQNYQLTFSQAQKVCSEYGTEIASKQDMLDARAAGFEFCNCGWLSDQTIGMVLQENHAYCYSSTYDAGFIYCDQDKANVYCKS